LGLSLCKQIVTLHGGTIGMTSQAGQGSVFHFSIPFLVLPAKSAHSNVSQTPQPPRSVNSSGDSSSFPLLAEAVSVDEKRLTVLVVDDVESNRKMLKMLLKRNGVFADVAENGQAAVDILLQQKAKYQIIFMDNQMPVLSGVEAVRQLRAGGFNNLLIGVTGNVMQDDVQEFLSAGCDLVLSKPLKMDLMVMLLAYVHREGCLSMAYSGMRLVEQSHALQWESYLLDG